MTGWEWIMGLFGFARPSDDVPPATLPDLPPVDQAALREDMARRDPDYRRVRSVHHDGLTVLGSQSLADGIALRREREFWERHGGRKK